MSVKYVRPTTPSGRNDIEDGPDAKRMYHLFTEEGTNAIIGFACEAGVIRNKGRTGARHAPDAIRKSLFNLSAPREIPSLTDLGDITVDGDDLEAGQAMLAKHISNGLSKHNRLLVLGGGHETAYGSYMGLRTAYPDTKIGIINLDAHLDLRNIGEVGPSSGTPFNQIRMLDPKAFDYLCLGVAEEANTQALFNRADEWGVNIVSDKDLINDFSSAHSKIKATIARNDLIYLTIDMDLLPHYQAPGVSAPAPRGVPLATVEAILEQIIASCKSGDCRIPLIDIVEVSPSHDIANITAKTAAILARKLLT
ncbi:formimidoylglutamase [Kordiimonas sp. SCSIO 12610]|uniref:formimidoylglutamase n=1 Tax=Kordiimonas sp. SCSIO 12610 TaxID=2829597 RepID=UPI0021086B71|nr:formimidoylglutamase [Kordiimonas sp. SCSIO 12610]UTW54723.1 formimidoylglutamase [Kordiimonas sp. SCSIO 12610]